MHITTRHIVKILSEFYLREYLLLLIFIANFNSVWINVKIKTLILLK